MIKICKGTESGRKDAVEMNQNLESLLDLANSGISEYLNKAKAAGRIDEQLYSYANENTYKNLSKWLLDPNIDRISRKLKEGIIKTIETGCEWENIVNSFRQSVKFGTGGIRGLMAFDKNSIIKLKTEGIDTDILKGPNTINDLVFLTTSDGVARFGKQKGFQKIVIGYDSRIRGRDFANIVARLFLGYDYTVFLFDAPCPYPEVTYAIPDSCVKADVGVMISASHNDYRYNGYKLSCGNGSQFDAEERNDMYENYIATARTEDIVNRLPSLRDAAQEKLWFLGGKEPIRGCDYEGREDHLIDMHSRHLKHVKSFLLVHDLREHEGSTSHPLRIGYCAYHGAGNVAVPRLLNEVGFVDVKPITVKGLNELNGLFPAFCDEPGREQQPDPGDPRAARIAVEAFKEEYGDKGLSKIDTLIGTDPDADRCGIITRVPESQESLCRYEGQRYYLLPADDMWTLVLWYRLQQEIEQKGRIVDSEKKFVVLSHTTSDAIACLSKKHGIGVIKTWVGFSMLAAATRDVWENRLEDMLSLVEGRNKKYEALCHPFACECSGFENGSRSINIAAMEQSNGFSILGAPPPDERSLGVGGHVRDKDGTFAALLIAEISAWAKRNNTSIINLLDEKIYLDKDIGLFATFYEPDPMDGEYPGIEGDRLKKNFLRSAMGYYQLALAGNLEIAGRQVKSAAIYRTGKYDSIYPPTYDFQFPDEGIRFYLDELKMEHVTIRPSGTGNSLRFHIQLHRSPSESNLPDIKAEVYKEGRIIMADIRRLLKAEKVENAG